MENTKIEQWQINHSRFLSQLLFKKMWKQLYNLKKITLKVTKITKKTRKIKIKFSCIDSCVIVHILSYKIIVCMFLKSLQNSSTSGPYLLVINHYSKTSCIHICIILFIHFEIIINNLLFITNNVYSLPLIDHNKT